MLEVERAERLRAQAVADGTRGQGGRPLDQRAGVEGLLGVGGQRGLGSPDADRGIAQAELFWRTSRRKLDGCGDSTQQPAAAHRREDQIHVRKLPRDLEPARGLAGDDVRMVVRRDDRVAVDGREFLGLELARRAGRADKDDLRSQREGGIDLHLRSVVRHDDDGLGPERAGRVGDALGVIAARVSNDAASKCVRCELRNHVVRAA